jgi:hypothetical protein
VRRSIKLASSKDRTIKLWDQTGSFYRFSAAYRHFLTVVFTVIRKSAPPPYDSRFTADLSGKHRAKSVPPKPNRLMSDADAAFMQ